MSNWKKTTDRPNLEAWHNPKEEILITLNQEVPTRFRKKYSVKTYFANSTHFVENDYSTKEEAIKFIETFKRHNP